MTEEIKKLLREVDLAHFRELNLARGGGITSLGKPKTFNEALHELKVYLLTNKNV